MLQHNNCMCIQPAESKFRVTIFVVYTNNLTMQQVHEAMTKVITVGEKNKKHSVKYLITEHIDIAPDQKGQEPYHDGNYHEHQKIISFNDPKRLNYLEWTRLIPYDGADKKK